MRITFNPLETLNFTIIIIIINIVIIAFRKIVIYVGPTFNALGVLYYMILHNNNNIII